MVTSSKLVVGSLKILFVPLMEVENGTENGTRVYIKEKYDETRFPLKTMTV